MAVEEKIVPAQLERRVYERVKSRILSGALLPGDQLVEARLADDFGVSKTPVREALIRLQRDGLVQIEPYRGARVVEPSEQDVREILELRLALECHTARELAERRPAGVLDELEKTVTQGRAALAAGDDARAIDTLTEFSDVMAAAGGNSRLARVLEELRSVLLLIGTTSLRAPGRAARSLDQHARILEALRSGDAEGAARATATHIRSVENDSLGAGRRSGEPATSGTAPDDPDASA